MSDTFDDDDPGRRVPHNPDAEQALIAGCLTSPTMLAHTINTVVPADFYSHANQRIYTAITHLHHTGQPVDIITVTDQVHRDDHGPVDPASVTSYLCGLGVTAHSPRYAAIVARDAHLRRLLAAARDLTDAIYNLDDTALDHAGKTLTELLQTGAP